MAFQNFSRALAGILAKELNIKWLYRPYTRIVAGWGRAFRKLFEYVDRNHFETVQIIEYKPRKRNTKLTEQRLRTLSDID